MLSTVVFHDCCKVLEFGVVLEFEVLTANIYLDLACKNGWVRIKLSFMTFTLLSPRRPIIDWCSSDRHVFAYNLFMIYIRFI